jgi:hypothetical protein
LYKKKSNTTITCYPLLPKGATNQASAEGIDSGVPLYQRPDKMIFDTEEMERKRDKENGYSTYP